MSREAIPGETRKLLNTLLTLGFNDRRMAYQRHALKKSRTVTTTIERSPVERTCHAVVRNKAGHEYGVNRTDREKLQGLGFMFIGKFHCGAGGSHRGPGHHASVEFPLQ
jgi:hypothetical protein